MKHKNIVGVITPLIPLFHKWIAENKKDDETYTIINKSHQLQGMEFTRIEKGYNSEEVSAEIHKEAQTRIKQQS